MYVPLVLKEIGINVSHPRHENVVSGSVLYLHDRAVSAKIAYIWPAGRHVADMSSSTLPAKLYIVYSPTPNIFGWLSCDYSLIGGKFTLPCFYIYNFCIAPFDIQNNGTAYSHTIQTPCLI